MILLGDLINAFGWLSVTRRALVTLLETVQVMPTDPAATDACAETPAFSFARVKQSYKCGQQLHCLGLKCIPI
jgi:hypothetical protein